MKTIILNFKGKMYHELKFKIIYINHLTSWFQFNKCINANKERTNKKLKE